MTTRITSPGHGLQPGDAISFPRGRLTVWQRFLIWLGGASWWPPAKLPPVEFVVTEINDANTFHIEPRDGGDERL